MNASFAGKKLLVVGGTSGMGFETAKLVLKNGGSVVLVDVIADSGVIVRTKPSRHARRWRLTARYPSSWLT